MNQPRAGRRKAAETEEPQRQLDPDQHLDPQLLQE